MTRPTWIFVAGPYRSGSTTQYQITRDLIEIAKLGVGIGYHTENKLREFDEKDSPHQYIVCKVFEYLPAGFRGETSHGELIHRQKRIRAIVSVRDPRDIIVSMRKRAKPEEFDFKKTATQDFPIWLGNVEKWIDMGSSYWSRFEEFTVDLPAEAERIAAFLELDLDSNVVREIGGRYTIPAQMRRKEEYKVSRPDTREDPWLPSIPAVLFGTSGHWRTWLQPDDAAMVVEANRKFFERFGYADS